MRRLRGRFGIAARRVAVRPHLPWHWRAVSIIALTGVSLALAGWIYDAGRQFAGFDRSVSDQESAALRERVSRLETELEAARRVANISDGQIQMATATQERLAAQIKTLEMENTRLKADLAMFENLADGPAGVEGPLLSQLQILPTGVQGAYRYRLLLAQTGGKRQQEFRGVLQLLGTVQRGKETAIIPLPLGEGSDGGLYKVSFRYFRRLEGSFSLDSGMRLERVEARLLQAGVVKASQHVVL
ncbi:MAG: hypothetical protein CVU17_06995 [Betaproteobacteria bacterium HGW-Betaproteobacteria-11]|nr:MAG: hypothetical protein CVU17_06995 [Betaproteobacteria bacterium HGW-Betaproteobacteria-11]